MSIKLICCLACGELSPLCDGPVCIVCRSGCEWFWGRK
jgi:hypothetical protein